MQIALIAALASRSSAGLKRGSAAAAAAAARAWRSCTHTCCSRDLAAAWQMK